LKTLTASTDPESNAELLLVKDDGCHLNRYVMRYREGDILRACYYAALEFGADEVELEDKKYSLSQLRGPVQ
jgi:16S rRNA U1498 N3-methylase RsmE